MLALHTHKKSLLVIVLFIFSVICSAQVVTPFTIRYQITQKGGIVFVSNSSVSCSASGACTTAKNEAAPAGTSVNNNFNATYIDIDGDASTFMSSSDSLNLPACSEISFAGLYWGAENLSGGSNWADRNKVKLKVNNGAYQNLTADQIQVNNVGYSSYHCYKDITSIVAANGGKARFTIANVATRVGSSNRFGGWTIVVVYKNDLQLMRNLTVFNGLSNVNNANNTTNIPVTGFLTPLSGPVTLELGMVVYDGDRSYTGDSLLFNGAGTFVPVSDALNPARDVFNSTFSRNGVQTAFRNPNINNSLGYDADIFFPNNITKNYIGNNTTSATIRQKTGGETYLTQVVTSAIDVYEPSLVCAVRVQDVNGGTVNAGDILEYTFTVKNTGSDPSVKTWVVDTLEGTADFVPGSIQILSGPNAGAKTDVTSDDQAEYDPTNRVVRVRVGLGANSMVGGRTVNSPTGADSTKFKFRVTVTTNCVLLRCDSVINNKIFVFGSGEISGNPFVTEGSEGAFDIFGCPLPGLPITPINIASCPLPVASSSSPACEGGSVNLTVTATPLATYSWTGPASFTSPLQNPTRTNFAGNMVGIYSVATRVNATCVHTTTTSVLMNISPSAATSVTNVACKSIPTGRATALSAGTNPFTYVWNTIPIRTTQTITGLAVGTYTVTITDGNNCVQVATAQISEPSSFLIASISTFTNASCTGGAATAIANGGVPPYSYGWQPNGTSGLSIAGVAPGTYTFTVTDSVNCKAIANVNISSVPPMTLTSNSTSVTCNGGTNGSASVAVAGGLMPYVFLWNTGSTNQNISNLSAGTYTVSVTDAQGCVKATSIIVTQPTAINASIIVSSDILCADVADGMIAASAVGGTGNLSYFWSPVAGTNASLTGLSLGGTYTVLVTDQNNCTGMTSGTINKVAQLVSTTATATVTCFGGSDATLNPMTVGGTMPYSYFWLPNGTTNSVASGLPMGTYTVITSDVNGCTDTSLAFVVQPPQVEIGINTVINNSTCTQPNGEIATTATGGTGPYTFLWSPSGGTNNTASGLSAGVYTIKVTDNAGCEKNAIIPLTDLAGPAVTFISKTDVSCFGQATGSIMASFTTATSGPYNIVWTPNTVTSATVLTTGNFSASGLAAGQYSVTVTDATGCVGGAVEIIKEPALLRAIGNKVNASCAGLTGSATVLAFGGVSSYTYQWNTIPVQSNTTATGLLAGNYQVTVADGNSCTTVVSYTVTEPVSLTAAISSQQNATCFGLNNGQATVTPTGGTPVYLFNWTPGNNAGPTITGVVANTYTVQVVDSKGCKAQVSTTITQPPALNLAVSTFTNVFCFGGNTGSATLLPSGGVPSYTYSWSGGIGLTTNASVSGLSSGNYFVTINDVNACSASTSLAIAEPPQLTVLANVLTQTTCNLSNGRATAAVSGGIFPYSYNWSFGGLTSQTISGLAPNTYSVTITDNNGCVASSNAVSVNNSLALVATLNVTSINCFAGSDGTATAVINNATAPILYNWNPLVSVSNFAANLPQGSYSLSVVDANGCTAVTSTTITKPAQALSLAGAVMQNVDCYGGSTGTILAAPFGGGNPNYQFLWTPGNQTNIQATGLSAGTYTVNVTDGNNCEVAATYVLAENAQVVASISTPPEFLCPGQFANLSASATGGTGSGYLFTWDNGLGVGPNHIVTPTTTTVYLVTVEDIGSPGCIGLAAEVVVNVSEFAQLNLTAYTSQTICEGDSVLLSTELTGAVNNFTYTWSNGIQAEEAFYVMPSSSTTYSVSAVNACGQLLTSSVEINVVKAPPIEILPESVNRCGPQAVEFKNAIVPPPDAEYTYTWKFENKVISTAVEPNYTFEQSGTFPVLLRIDDRGCFAIDTAQVTINISSPPLADFSYQPTEVKQLNPLVYFNNETYNANYYKWYFTEQEQDSSEVENPSYLYQDTGTFKVKLIAYKIVGDSTCRDTVIKDIKINPEITLYIPNAFTPNEDHQNSLFQAKGINLKEVYMEIYDRWGARIYVTPDKTDLSAGWDGTYKGLPAKQEVYVYKVIITDYRNKTYDPYVGDVTLIR